MVLQQREGGHKFLIVFPLSQFIIRAHFIITGGVYNPPSGLINIDMY